MNDTQKWILFWVFIGAFLIITGLTIWGVFFGLAELSDTYKDKLFYALILEILGAVIVLFKTGFAQKAESALTKKIWIDFEDGMDVKKYVGKNVTISPRGEDGTPLTEDISNSIMKDRALYVTPELPEGTTNVFITLELDEEVFEGSFSANSYVVKLEDQEL